MFVSQIYNHTELTMRKVPFICRQKQFKYEIYKLKINTIKRLNSKKRSNFTHFFVNVLKQFNRWQFNNQYKNKGINRYKVCSSYTTWEVKNSNVSKCLLLSALEAILTIS